MKNLLGKTARINNCGKEHYGNHTYIHKCTEQAVTLCFIALFYDLR